MSRNFGTLISKLAYFFVLYILFILSVDLISSRSSILPPNIALWNFYLIIPFIGGYFSNEEKIRSTLNFIGYSSLYVLSIPIIFDVMRVSYLDVTFFSSLLYWFLGPFSFYVGNIAKNYKVLILLYPLLLLAFDLSKISFYPYSSYFFIIGSIFNGSVIIAWVWRKTRHEG